MNGCVALEDFNLSQLKFIQTLEITEHSITSLEFISASGFLKAVLSSITLPGSLNVVVIHRDIVPVFDPLDCKQAPLCLRHSQVDDIVMNERRFRKQLRVIREMHSVRGFRLVLCLDSVDCLMDKSRRLMEKIVTDAGEKGAFDFLSCKPLLVCERRILRTRVSDYTVGVWRSLISTSCL